MPLSLAARAAVSLTLGLAACATAGDVGGGPDAAEVDAAEVDAATVDAAEVDAAVVDAAEVDAAVADAAVADAAVADARPVDAMPPIDAMPPVDACVLTWSNLLGNGGFEVGVTPWTQTSTIIRTAAQMPFGPQAGTYAALFGASNNANDVLVQTVTIPATATALRVRGYQCHVTEDILADTDTFRATLETPAGTVLETFTDITNSDVAPICIWTSFTWTAAAAHPGQQVVLKFQGRTNLALLTRFVVDSLSLEALACP
ncbi:MAG: hypothetical protein R3B06_24100 [Kofleriaceae bacterium]